MDTHTKTLNHDMQKLLTLGTQGKTQSIIILLFTLAAFVISVTLESVACALPFRMMNPAQGLAFAAWIAGLVCLAIGLYRAYDSTRDILYVAPDAVDELAEHMSELHLDDELTEDEDIKQVITVAIIASNAEENVHAQEQAIILLMSGVLLECVMWLLLRL